MEATEKRGKVRVLICGNAGSGKTTLLRHVRDDVDVSTSSTTPSTSTTTTTSTATKTMRQHQHNLSVVVENVERTIGCSTDVKLIFHEHARTEHFVELWDVGGHDQFKDDRAAFFRDINAVILVHDASQKNSALTLERWAREIAQQGTFVAPDTQIPNPWMTSTRDPHVIYGFGGLPVPCLVVSNKSDKAYVLGKGDVAGLKAKTAFGGYLKKIGLRLQPILPTTTTSGNNAGIIDEDYNDLVSTQGNSPTLGFRNSHHHHHRQASGGNNIDYFLDPRVPRGALDKRPIPRGLRCSALHGRVDHSSFDAFFKEIIDRRYYSNLSLNLSSVPTQNQAPDSSNLTRRSHDAYEFSDDLV
jgi:GTPase SAR1 family protein